jgi:hypothetical protein
LSQSRDGPHTKKGRLDENNSKNNKNNKQQQATKQQDQNNKRQQKQQNKTTSNVNPLQSTNVDVYLRPTRISISVWKLLTLLHRSANSIIFTTTCTRFSNAVCDTISVATQYVV